MYTLPSAIITSPNWPRKYDNNMDCTYIIDVPNGIAISLTFETFDLETDSGIRDGDVLYYGMGDNADTSKADGELSGYTIPDSIYMETGTMWLRFISNSIKTFTGFRLNYVVTSSKCQC